MTGRLGEIALAGGIAAALAAALLWLRVALLGGPARAARVAGWATFMAAAVACLALEWALLTHDFSVGYVAENGGRHVPVYYTITSLWSAQDGSLLLWLLILSGLGLLQSRRAPAGAPTLHPWAMTVTGVVTVFFFALSYFGANPFAAVHPVPADGPGPNPLLRTHPAMGLHPPLLYAGYLGLVVPFAYAVAALIRADSGRGWQEATRRWTLRSWSLLTAGIVLGGWWSYAVLGWGGYWAWDPVENASLLPWLTATALVHTTLVQSRRAAFTGWSVFLACASFLLVLMGTFLTRSGAVASIHSFTQSPLGPMLLGFVVLVVAVVTCLAALRGGRLSPSRLDTAVLSREAMLLANPVLFISLAVIILTGTLFPLIGEALAGARTAVGAGYFNRTAVPVALVVLVLMGAAPLMRWRGEPAAAVGRRLGPPFAAALATVAVVGALGRPAPIVLITVGVAAFGVVATGRVAAAELRRLVIPGRRFATVLARRRRYGALLAHAGIATVAVGVAASSGYLAVTEREVAVGQRLAASTVTAQLVDIERHRAGDSMVVTSVVRLERHGRPLGTVRPTLRYYPARDMTVSVPAIRSRPAGDVYLTVVSVSDDGRTANIRLATNPLVGLVWLGGALVACGGLLAIGRRRPTGPRTRDPDADLVGTP